MSRARRRALLATLALGASLLAVAPAHAASATVVGKPGPMAKLYRADVKRRPGAASARAQRLTVVAGSAGAPRSTWNVTYSGFTPEARTSFQAAVDIWAGIVRSPVPINVAADFTDLGSGVLGFAGPHTIIPIKGAGDGTSWYPVALANALTGTDQVPAKTGETGVDIDASFSSTESGIYYGTDSNPPAGYVDFESIVLHELGHGLGFTGSADYDASTGAGHYESPRFIFDYFNVSGPTTGQRLISLPNSSTTLGSAFTSNNVYWDGNQAKAANGGNRVKLYAPNPWEDGSSIAHLDENTFLPGDQNSLMTPYVGNQEVVHSPGPIMIGMMRDMGWDAAFGVPAAPGNVVAEANEAAVDLSWTAPASNGTPVTGYKIDVLSGSTLVKTISPAGTATSYQVTGLTDGTTYSFRVYATNSSGEGPGATSNEVQPAPDTTAPAMTITSVHTSGVGPADGAYTFDGTDAGHAHPTLTYACSLNGAPATPCTSPQRYSYADGTSNSLTVTATDAAGNVSPPVTATWTADGGLPTVATPALPTYTTASVLQARATGADANTAGFSGLKDFDFRYRRAAFSGSFSALTYPATWQGVTHLVSLPAAQGYTYCFSARSRDNAGNTSAWSGEQCTSTVLDDRGLVAGSGWTRASYAKHYLKTDTQTTAVGVTLTRTNVQTRRLALVAVKCAKCGTVGVYFNGRLIKNVNLKQAATAYQVVFPIISFPGLQSGTVVIKPLTKGAVTYIDGLAMSKV